MNIVKKAKDISQEVEKGVEVVGKKVADTFDNIASHLPFANLAKKEDATFHIEVDLPGVKKEDIDLKVEDNILVVRALRKFKNEVKKEDYYICESSFGKMERRFVLPETVDSSKIEASYNDGRLEISLHKTEQAQPKSIKIG